MISNARFSHDSVKNKQNVDLVNQLEDFCFIQEHDFRIMKTEKGKGNDFHVYRNASINHLKGSLLGIREHFKSNANNVLG